MPHEIWLYSDVAEWASGAASSAGMAAILGEHAGEDIELRINSRGGSVFEGMAIYTQLQRHSGRKVAFIDGVAASIASVIAMAADEIHMGEGSFMMIHEASGFSMGGSEDLERDAALLRSINDAMAGIYARRTGKTADEIAAAMARETWFNAQEAVDYGLADDVVEAMAAAAHAFDLSLYRNVPAALHATSAQPWNRTQRMDLTKIASMLACAPTPEAVDRALAELQNHKAAHLDAVSVAKAAEDALATAKQRIVTLEVEANQGKTAAILAEMRRQGLIAKGSKSEARAEELHAAGDVAQIQALSEMLAERGPSVPVGPRQSTPASNAPTAGLAKPPRKADGTIDFDKVAESLSPETKESYSAAVQVSSWQAVLSVPSATHLWVEAGFERGA